MKITRPFSTPAVLSNHLIQLLLCESKRIYLILFTFLALFYTLPALSAVEINYAYDDLNRLKTVVRADGPTLQYNYDEVGNFVDQAVSNSPDTDGDQIANFVDTDDDNDSLPDTWEIQYNLDPLDPSDASGDPDGDGLTNLQEFQGGTSPIQHNGGNPVPTLPQWALFLFVIILSYQIFRQSRKRQGV